MSATNVCLFCITRFLYGLQKIFLNKNIFSKHDLHVLFISFFSKMYNKNLLFLAVGSFNEVKERGSLVMQRVQLVYNYGLLPL